ncbi:hypothetical protein PR048_028260 [Dryococelus australis]|uniref:Uncharacterized protein n=1 Tax=Dryococelus australis TaxID=614101 RepID=A0ABQ9GIR8_9NEOP|nr:hypothetical protein PR048_028260 [Dryococelus australis]
MMAELPVGAAGSCRARQGIRAECGTERAAVLQYGWHDACAHSHLLQLLSHCARRSHHLAPQSKTVVSVIWPLAVSQVSGRAAHHGMTFSVPSRACDRLAFTRVGRDNNERHIRLYYAAYVQDTSRRHGEGESHLNPWPGLSYDSSSVCWALFTNLETFYDTWDKPSVKHVFVLAIGAQFIRHAQVNSEPLVAMQGNQRRIACHLVKLAGPCDITSSLLHVAPAALATVKAPRHAVVKALTHLPLILRRDLTQVQNVARSGEGALGARGSLALIAASLLSCKQGSDAEQTDPRRSPHPSIGPSPPHTKAIRGQSPAESLWILACGNRAGRFRWSAGIPGDLPPPPPPFRHRSILTPITLIGSQNLDVNRPNLFTHSSSRCFTMPIAVGRLDHGQDRGSERGSQETSQEDVVASADDCEFLSGWVKSPGSCCLSPWKTVRVALLMTLQHLQSWPCIHPSWMLPQRGVILQYVLQTTRHYNTPVGRLVDSFTPSPIAATRRLSFEETKTRLSVIYDQASYRATGRKVTNPSERNDFQGLLVHRGDDDYIREETDLARANSLIARP